MEIITRDTLAEEFKKTEFITREAFWDLYKPGADEHLILHQLRNSKSYIKALDLVAVYENDIVGHAISTKAKVTDDKNTEHEVLCVGPISVIQILQNRGIGSKLMHHSISIARDLGYAGMILFGNPDYYHRFGFRDAAIYNITTKEGQNFEPFMALELQQDGFMNISGKFYEDSAFEVKPEELDAFEKNFPFKEKHKTATQLHQ